MFPYSSNYLLSPWCIEEFLLAHEKVVTKQKNYLIPVLTEDLDTNELSKHPELETYIRTHTYIDARSLQDETLPDPAKVVEAIRKKIRYSCFHVYIICQLWEFMQMTMTRCAKFVGWGWYFSECKINQSGLSHLNSYMRGKGRFFFSLADLFILYHIHPKMMESRTVTPNNGF